MSAQTRVVAGGARALLLVVSLLFVAGARASVTVYVHGLNQILPNYFSGTNSRISGHAHVGPGSMGFTEAWLLVGGVEAYHETRPVPDGEEWLANWNVNVMFDSTVFPSGQSVQVEFKVRDDTGALYSGFASIPVINRAVIYGRFDMDVWPVTWASSRYEYVLGNSNWASTDVVQNKLAEIGYGIHALVTSLLWEATGHSADIGQATSFYVASHGGSGGGGFFRTDADDYFPQYSGNPSGPPTTPPEFMNGVTPMGASWHQILPIRVAANGTGLPPFNSGEPPINLAFVMACATATDNELAEAFLYPLGNAYTGAPLSFPENQAQCGYSINVRLDDYQAQATRFFQSLKEGYTANAARVHAQQAYSVELDENFLIVWGDFATKLKGVYQGNPDDLNADLSFSRVL